MAQMAEFEEKTYEKYFGQELVRGRPISFSPGQCSENALGFDEAFRVPWFDLHWRFGHLMPNIWSSLSGIDPKDLNRFANDLSGHLPKFKFNLFVQYKRPEFVTGNNAKQRQYWKQSYYRYKLTPQQQNTLEKLHTLSIGRAGVVYASPAFWTDADLFKAAEKRKVISNSNIVSVDKLTGHGRFTYVASGGTGKAFSEPVDIEGLTIQQIIENGLEQKDQPFNQHIKGAAKLIEDALKEDIKDMELLTQARLAIVGGREIKAAIGSPDSFSYALATIEAFKDAFGVTLYAMG
jgi:hypothetical protein